METVLVIVIFFLLLVVWTLFSVFWHLSGALGGKKSFWDPFMRFPVNILSLIASMF